MALTNTKEAKQLGIQSGSGIPYAGKRIQVPNIVCQFESKKHPCDLYKECFEWYKKSKSSLHGGAERFDSFYEWSCFAFPNFSKEMLFWTINMSNCIFDLDDYISYVLPHPNFMTYYQLSRIIFRSSLPLNEPESICPGYNLHNAEAIQEAFKNIKLLANGSPHGDFVVRDWEEWFQNQYYDRIVAPKFASVEDYLTYRYVNVAGSPYASIVMLGLGYDFPMEIFLHKYVAGINQRVTGYVAIVNDLFSYNREIETETEPCNILNYGSIEYAVDLIRQFEDEMLDLIEKIKEKEWIVEGKDYNTQVLDYCENTKYLCAGTLNWSKVSTRYRSYNEVDVGEDDDLHGIMNVVQRRMKKLNWKNGENILDYGCGTGHMASVYLFPKLEETNSKLYGVDTSKTMIEYAKANFANKNVEYFKTTLGDNDFTLKKERFDKIFSIGVLHCDKMYKETIGKMFELLVPGGQLILVLVTKSRAFDALQYVKGLTDWVQLADTLHVPEWVSDGDVDVGARFEQLLNQIGFHSLEVFTKDESYNFCSEKEWANWLVAGIRGTGELSLSEDKQRDLIETMHLFILKNKNGLEVEQVGCEMLFIHAEKPAK